MLCENASDYTKYVPTPANARTAMESHTYWPATLHDHDHNGKRGLSFGTLTDCGYRRPKG